jgi:hypothetical protein
VKKATLESLQARLGEYIASSAKQPVLILRDGEPVAVLVGLGGKKKKPPVKLREVLKRAWLDYEEHGGIPHDEFWEAVAKETDRGSKTDSR